MTFKYYYGSQAEQFSFVRIPRIMLTDKAFHDLSITSKVLYGVLLDRMSLSMKNSWFDEENRVYIIYQIGEIMEDLGLTKRKAMDLLQELEAFGLLEKKRRGHGLPNILYVKNFMHDDSIRSAGIGTSESEEIEENHPLSDSLSENSGSSSAEKDTSDNTLQQSRGDDFGTQEVQISAPLEVQDFAPLKNQTNNNYTYRSKDSNLILSAERLMRYDAMRPETSPVETTDKTADAYRRIIMSNIDYDSLMIAHDNNRAQIDGIVDLILETVLCHQEYVLIASNQYPLAVVKSKFMKLNYSHIDYVLRCLRRNTTKIKNIKKYLLAALFNAPSTIDGYYQAEVQHDMPQLALQ